jgi:hypothetical protein
VARDGGEPLVPIGCLVGFRTGQFRGRDAGGVHAEERFACCRVGERCALIYQPFRTAAGLLPYRSHDNTFLDRSTPISRPENAIRGVTAHRSALLFGILEGRCSNQVAGVGALKANDVTFTNTGVHGAVRSARLVCEAAEIRLDELFLEAFARVPGDNIIAQLRRKLIEPFSEYIETDARIE